MKDISSFQKIFIARDHVDFRKQAPGLALISKHTLDIDPMVNRALFVFINRRRTAVKMLYWDQTGYALWAKTLEKDRYHWPRPKQGEAKISIGIKELKWLLDGVDLNKIKTHQKIILD